MWSTRDVHPLSPSAAPRVSPAQKHGSFDQLLFLSSMLTGFCGVRRPVQDDRHKISIISYLHVLGTTDGSSISRGRSVSEQSSARPPTFSAGTGSVLHTPACNPSLPRAEAICSVSRAPVTSLTNASCSSREHASNSERFFQNSCGVVPYNAVGLVVPRLAEPIIIIIILVITRLVRKSMIAHLQWTHNS